MRNAFDIQEGLDMFKCGVSTWNCLPMTTRITTRLLVIELGVSRETARAILEIDFHKIRFVPYSLCKPMSFYSHATLQKRTFSDEQLFSAA